MSKENANVIRNYDPNEITDELLYYGEDWDAIELNYELDPKELDNWYQWLKENFEHMHFDFYNFPNLINREISDQYMRYGYCGYYCGPISGFTLSWPVDRDIPIPPPSQANKEMFPETLDPSFYDKCQIRPKFREGYLNTMIDALGEDSFIQAIVTVHDEGAKIMQHCDSRVKKLHIPLRTHENAVFKFGEDGEREFNMKVGKIYVLNTHIHHGTDNPGPGERAHILTRVDEDSIHDVLALENNK